MKMNWQQFGLKANPFDTMPLVEGGSLSIEDAFIGREEEREYLDNLLDNEDGVCLAVCGDTGVGKTSLINFQKFIWKYNRIKLLFSCRREIEATDTLLDKQSFILEIIASVLREISLLDQNLHKSQFLQRLKALIDYTQMVNISGGLNFPSVGANISRDKTSTTPIKMTTSAVEQHFSDLMDFLKTNEVGGKKYSGLIIHVNNFDVILQDKTQTKKAVAFFNEIRDFLQTKDTYFLFLGPIQLYNEVIAVEQRVKSIFIRSSLIVKPLSKKDVAVALNKRMELLKSDDVKRYISPIGDEVIYRLYDLYGGDIRSIMTGIKDILSHCSDRLLQPLSVNEAMTLLGRERWGKIENHLTIEQRKILEFLIQNDTFITVQEADKLVGKQASNISGYYFPPLKTLGIIEEKERKGTRIFLGLTKEYEPLKWWLDSQKEVEKDVNAAELVQSKLFE